MSHMSDIDIEMKNLEADVEALRGRVIIERQIADYWFERCLIAEKKNDEIINQ